jgi:hypothetical protein
MLFAKMRGQRQGSEDERLWDHDLIKMKIDSQHLALVAFRTRDLGEEYFQDRGIETCYLVDESELDQALREAISGDDVFIYESSEMIREIGRRGSSFPFIDFVTSYQPVDPV